MIVAGLEFTKITLYPSNWKLLGQKNVVELIISLSDIKDLTNISQNGYTIVKEIIINKITFKTVRILFIENFLLFILLYSDTYTIYSPALLIISTILFAPNNKAIFITFENNPTAVPTSNSPSPIPYR